jgi:predicted amidohydrolase
MSIRIAAAAFPIIDDIHHAVNCMLHTVRAAKDADCDLIVFPEAVLGGMEISGNYATDCLLTLPLEHPELNRIRDCAQKEGIGIGFGFLESVDEMIYDAYLIYDHAGELCLHYRRVSRTWHPSEAPAAHYACGEKIQITDTPYGKICVLICGDLFEEDVLKCLSNVEPDLYLHPMARAFKLSKDMQQLWDDDEFPYYLEEYRKLKAEVLVCNALDTTPQGDYAYCGGAWFIKDAQLHSSLPLMQEGLLMVDIESLKSELVSE